MEPKDIITLFLAGWGAILSTLLGIRELKKTKRRVNVFLEFVVGVEGYRIIVVNIGYRPITIVSVGIRLFIKKGVRRIPFEAIPVKLILSSPDEIYPLPVTLNDGEHIALELEDIFNEELRTGAVFGEAYARDSEGKVYKAKKTREYDLKTDKIY